MRDFMTAVVAASFLLAPHTARADGPGKSQLAQALFDEAKKLIAENNFAEACPKLAESQRIDPSSGTILHLGICHEGQGKTGSAYAELNDALSAARRDGRADRESVAKAHLAAIAPKLVRLTVTVQPEARVAGLEITWNGTAIPEAQWGLAFPVDPGEHVLTAAAPGRRKWTTRVEIAREPVSSVAIPVLPVEASEPPALTPPPPVVAPPVKSDPDRVSSDGASQRTIGVVAAAAGVIAIGVGTVFELRALSAAKDRDDAARAGDASTTASKQEDAKSAQTVGFIVGGVGIAALGAGIALFLTAPSSAKPASGGRTRGVAVTPILAPSAGGIVVSAPLF
jgi:hypothetical protein